VSDQATNEARSRGRKEDFILRFEELILSGRFKAGERLPPERELAESLGASRPVVHAALGELAARGIRLAERRESLPPAATHSSSR